MRPASPTADGNWEIMKGIKRELAAQKDYPTYAMMKYCLPDPNANATMYEAFMSQSQSKDTVKQVMMGFSYLMENVNILYGAAFLALLLGYAFMFFVRICIGPLMIVMLLVAEIGILVVGRYLVYAPICGGKFGVVDGVEKTSCPFELYPSPTFYKEHGPAMMTIGGVVLILWLLGSLALCCMSHSIQAVQEAIKRGSMLVAAMSTLLVQPLIQVIVKIPVFHVCMYSLAWVVSLGEPTPEVLNDSVSGTSVKGLNRSFKFTQSEWYMIIVWVYNDLVYTEVALSGKGYIGAVRTVLKVLMGNAPEYAIAEYALGFTKVLGRCRYRCGLGHMRVTRPWGGAGRYRHVHPHLRAGAGPGWRACPSVRGRRAWHGSDGRGGEVVRL